MQRMAEGERRGGKGRGGARGYSKRAEFLTNAFRDGLGKAW